MLNGRGKPAHFLLSNYALRQWREQSGRSDGVPDALVTAAELPIEAHLAMQAALQTFVDNSISKTINVPAQTSFADFAPIYRTRLRQGSERLHHISANGRKRHRAWSNAGTGGRNVRVRQ